MPMKEVKKTTSFELSNLEDVIIKNYLDEKLSKIYADLSLLEKDYKEIKLPSNQQSVDEILNQRAVNTTVLILYDKRIFEYYDKGNADEVLKNFLFVKRRRPNFEE